jgi:hypothetical protein
MQSLLEETLSTNLSKREKKLHSHPKTSLIFNTLIETILSDFALTTTTRVTSTNTNIDISNHVAHIVNKVLYTIFLGISTTLF